jgi:hypothetical protein
MEEVAARLARTNKKTKSKPPSAPRHLLRADSPVFEVCHVLSAEEAKMFIDLCEGGDMVRTKQRQTREYAHRENDRLSFTSPALASALYERLRPSIPSKFDSMHAAGCNSNIRLYRYLEGDAFGPHIDQSDLDGDTMSCFTVLIYLNDAETSDLVGGRTIFYENANGRRKERVALAYSPKMGCALIHGHGQHCLLHEGEKVQRGCKYVLRTDLMYSVGFSR